jgi:hypothetical protein
MEQRKKGKAERKKRHEIRNAYKAVKGGVLDMLPRQEVSEMGKATGFSQRQDKGITAFEFVLCCALAATLESKRGFASVWRVLCAATGRDFARSAVTQRFGSGSAELLKEVFELLVTRCPSSSHPELLSKLEQFDGVLSHDGSVLAVSSLLCKLFSSTRTNSVPAAAKVHATADLVHRCVIGVEITSERKSEMAVAWEQPILPNTLCIDDLGYYCHDYFGKIVAAGGHFLSRLKGGIKPIIGEVYQGVRAPKASVGKGLHEVQFVESSDTFDVLAEFSTTAGPLEFRVVGVRDTETRQWHCYVTDLPPWDFTPQEIANLYELRWVIELLFLQLKSFCHLDHVETSNPDAVRTHIYASLIASLIFHALLVTSAKAAGLEPSEVSHLTVAAAAPLLAVPLLMLWLGMELTKERLAQLLVHAIAVGCRQQNPKRQRLKWGGLGGNT